MEVIALIGPIYDERRLNYLDLRMMFFDSDAIRKDRRIIPTLLRLTGAIDKKLGRELIRIRPKT